MIPDIGWVADGSMAPDQLIAFSTLSALLWETSKIKMEDTLIINYISIIFYIYWKYNIML